MPGPAKHIKRGSAGPAGVERRSGKGSVCATRADVRRGRRGWWTSSLDRVPQVSDAIRCRDDIRVVQFWRLAAEMLDESRCRLPP